MGEKEDEEEEVRVCVFAIPMRRRDGVEVGREKSEVRD